MSDRSHSSEKFGAYEVLEELSKSSRSRVLKAMLPQSQRPVVIKVLPTALSADTDSVARFHQEVGALREVNHSNVALILDSGQEGDSLFLVMEFVPLTALSRVLRRRRLTLAQAMTVFKNICLGVQAIHGHKVVHRNLNPTSILVSDELSMIKVAGFGSRATTTSHSSEMETMATGRLNVAFHYVAPEQAKGGPPTERGDVFALGMILYEMLTGRLPMGRVGLPSRINTELPAEVDRLVLNCLAPRPEDRFSSVREVLEALDRLEDRLRLGVVNEFSGLVRGTSKMVRHRAGMLALLGVVGAAGIGLGAYWLLRGGRADEPPMPEPQAIRVAAPETFDTPEATLTPPPPPGSEPVESGETATADRVDLPEPTASEPDDAAESRQMAESDEAPEAAANTPRPTATTPPEETDALADSRAAETLLRLAEKSELESGRTHQNQARELYGEVAANYPESPWAPVALAARARLEKESNIKISDADFDRKVPAALVTSRRLVMRYPDSPQAEEALWIMGGEYGDLKRFDQAVQAFTALIDRFPGTAFDAWWEAAQIYDKRLDDVTAAIDAYSRVPETSEHFEAAQRRLKKLGG